MVKKMPCGLCRMASPFEGALPPLFYLVGLKISLERFGALTRVEPAPTPFLLWISCLVCSKIICSAKFQGGVAQLGAQKFT